MLFSSPRSFLARVERGESFIPQERDEGGDADSILLFLRLTDPMIAVSLEST
jgi:hypothetical protein